MTEDECCYIRTSGSCCGRPFVVAGEARSARVQASVEWSGEPAAFEHDIDANTRAELARAWLADALLEHASIASFARFTLHALSLGAPAELLAASQLAALDEVAHAQLCFGLANRYATGSVGPGPLAMDGALAPVSLAEAAAASVREGCVGETLAALQAMAQLELATDAQVREALRRIADDEARHAELAWRFVGWALARGGEPVRDAVEQAFRSALAQVHAEPLRAQPAIDEAVWHAHGRLTSTEERACWREAVRDVIEPCVQRLTGVDIDLSRERSLRG